MLWPPRKPRIYVMLWLNWVICKVLTENMGLEGMKASEEGATLTAEEDSELER